MKNLGSYRVGWPPKKTQFKTGASGNPKGRPKGSKRIVSLLQKACQQNVRVNGPNGPRHMSEIDASITQLVNNAATGYPRATREVMRMAKDLGELETLMHPPSLTINFVTPEEVRRRQAEQRLDEERREAR